MCLACPIHWHFSPMILIDWLPESNSYFLRPMTYHCNHLNHKQCVYTIVTKSPFPQNAEKNWDSTPMLTWSLNNIFLWLQEKDGIMEKRALAWSKHSKHFKTLCGHVETQWLHIRHSLSKTYCVKVHLFLSLHSNVYNRFGLVSHFSKIFLNSSQ